jgi:hypothetical protein
MQASSILAVYQDVGFAYGVAPFFSIQMKDFRHDVLRREKKQFQFFLLPSQKTSTRL